MTVPQLNDVQFFREMDEPSSHVVAVTPNDSTNLSQFTRGLYVGGAGDVAVITGAGDTVTFSGVLAGAILPVRVYRVLFTGTTASLILAMY